MSERQVRYIDGLDIVLVATCGVYILGHEIETLKKAFKIAQENNCKRLLFDHRKAKVKVETMEGYDRPSIYKNLGFDRSIKLASLVAELDEGLKFYETVCFNRGWQMQVFDDYESALSWLMAESPVKNDR